MRICIYVQTVQQQQKRIVIWHIFWDIGAKVKNVPRLSHLYMVD